MVYCFQLSGVKVIGVVMVVYEVLGYFESGRNKGNIVSGAYKYHYMPQLSEHEEFI